MDTLTEIHYGSKQVLGGKRIIILHTYSATLKKNTLLFVFKL